MAIKIAWNLKEITEQMVWTIKTFEKLVFITDTPLTYDIPYEVAFSMSWKQILEVGRARQNIVQSQSGFLSFLAILKKPAFVSEVKRLSSISNILNWLTKALQLLKLQVTFRCSIFWVFHRLF